jgi:hypothetical protein
VVGSLEERLLVMESKRQFLHLGMSVLVSFGFFLMSGIVFTSNAPSDRSGQLLDSYTHEADGGDCLSQSEIAEQVNGLLIRNVADQAQLLLVDNGKKSGECRKRVVKELINMMSKHTEIGNDLNSSNAWFHGAKILADLKPIEALDFLISNLTLWDGTSGFGPSHLPAVGVIIKIGSVAIPKLRSVMTSSSDKTMRFYAIYCAGQIGGSSARRALESALRRETDPCVSRFMKFTIDSFHNRALPNHISARDRTNWLVAFMHGC